MPHEAQFKLNVADTHAKYAPFSWIDTSPEYKIDIYDRYKIGQGWEDFLFIQRSLVAIAKERGNHTAFHCANIICALHVISDKSMRFRVMYIETKMSSLRRNCYHWLHWDLSFCNLQCRQWWTFYHNQNICIALYILNLFLLPAHNTSWTVCIIPVV